MALLGADIGSSSVKAAVFEDDGTLLAKGTAFYTADVREGGRAEVGADKLFGAFVNAVREATQKAGKKAAALAVSSHGESFVAVNKDGEAVSNFIMNSDNRAVEQADFLERRFGKETLYRITGVPVHPMFGLMKIMHGLWHGCYGNAARFLNAGDYILQRLGVTPYTDYTLASRMFGFSLRDKQFDGSILEAAGVRREQMPEVVPAGTTAGKLDRKMSELLGVQPGAAVAVGGHDQACGAFGMGIAETGTGVSAGTYESIVCVDGNLHNTAEALRYNLNHFCYVYPDTYAAMAFYPAGGTVKWLVDNFFGEDRLIAGREGETLYDRLEKKAEEIHGPTNITFAPHLVGACNPDWDVNATGTIAGLRPETTRYHLYKAVYEGIACEMAKNAEALSHIGFLFREANISGGGSRADFTVQLRASLTGSAIHKLTTDEAVCQGAAMIAGAGTGVFADFRQAKRAMVKVERTIRPDARQAREYEKQLEQYKTLYRDLADYRRGNENEQ